MNIPSAAVTVHPSGEQTTAVSNLSMDPLILGDRGKQKRVYSMVWFISGVPSVLVFRDFSSVFYGTLKFAELSGWRVGAPIPRHHPVFLWTGRGSKIYDFHLVVTGFGELTSSGPSHKPYGVFSLSNSLVPLILGPLASDVGTILLPSVGDETSPWVVPPGVFSGSFYILASHTGGDYHSACSSEL